VFLSLLFSGKQSRSGIEPSLLEQQTNKARNRNNPKLGLANPEKERSIPEPAPATASQSWDFLCSTISTLFSRDHLTNTHIHIHTHWLWHLLWRKSRGERHDYGAEAVRWDALLICTGNPQPQKRQKESEKQRIWEDMEAERSRHSTVAFAGA
jgi:hypothetical protein